MIELKNISKTFHQKNKKLKALNNVSLNVEKGEILGIIGFSGAGKSTLIRSVNLLEKPDEGQIIINGIDFSELNSKQLAKQRKKIGMIFQHFNLLSSRTVSENIALPLELDNVSKSKIKEKVNELLEIVGLQDKANEFPKNLSGGQKQRVAIARALANDPHLLLCDEATSALDPATTQSILELLKGINERLNITILLITHEMEVVKTICHRIAVIDQGEISAIGTLEEIINNKENDTIKKFIINKKFTMPPEIKIQNTTEQNLDSFPLVEIQLNGEIPFDELLSIIYDEFNISYKLLKADVEYLGKSNFGKLLLHLKGSTVENNTIIEYFNEINIQTTIRGYAA